MTAKMVAVGYAASLPITEERSLFEFETPVPRPGDRDLLVRVQAVSVNPVDVKARMRRAGDRGPARHPGLGCGRHRRGGRPRLQPVQARRPRLLRGQHQPPRHRRAFPPGRRAHRRPQAQVAELRAGRRPAAHHADRLGAAVRPDRRQARRRCGPALAPVVGGAGGVGSIAIQLARKLTGLTVIATASRPQTADVGAEPRRAPRDRPQQAVRPAAEGGRLSPPSTSCCR